MSYSVKIFVRLSNGLLERKRRQIKSGLALDNRILKYILTNLKAKVDNIYISSNRKRWMLILGTYLIMCFLCSLRGNEELMVELGGLIQHIMVERVSMNIIHML